MTVLGAIAYLVRCVRVWQSLPLPEETLFSEAEVPVLHHRFEPEPVAPAAARAVLHDWPTHGRISSRFGPRWGRMHAGIDIAAPTGNPVWTTADGVVAFAGWRGHLGLTVIVDHGHGHQTIYGHLSSVGVRVSERLSAGQVLGAVGSTGRSTGPHVHYAVRLHGRLVDPLSVQGSGIASGSTQR